MFPLHPTHEGEWEQRKGRLIPADKSPRYRPDASECVRDGEQVCLFQDTRELGLADSGIHGPDGLEDKLRPAAAGQCRRFDGCRFSRCRRFSLGGRFRRCRLGGLRLAPTTLCSQGQARRYHLTTDFRSRRQLLRARLTGPRNQHVTKRLPVRHQPRQTFDAIGNGRTGGPNGLERGHILHPDLGDFIFRSTDIFLWHNFETLRSMGRTVHASPERDIQRFRTSAHGVNGRALTSRQLFTFGWNHHPHEGNAPRSFTLTPDAVSLTCTPGKTVAVIPPADSGSIIRDVTSLSAPQRAQGIAYRVNLPNGAKTTIREFSRPESPYPPLPKARLIAHSASAFGWQFTP